MATTIIFGEGNEGKKDTEQKWWLNVSFNREMFIYENKLLQLKSIIRKFGEKPRVYKWQEVIFMLLQPLKTNFLNI